jgi:hypothetical protein
VLQTFLPNESFLKMASPKLFFLVMIAGFLISMVPGFSNANANPVVQMPRQPLLASVASATASKAAERHMKRQQRRLNRFQKWVGKHLRGSYNGGAGWNFEWTVASVILAVIGGISIVLVFASPWFFPLYLVLLALLLLVLKGFGVVHF